MYRSFKERSSQQGCVGFGSAAQVSHFPTLGLSPVIQVSGEEAIAPLDSVASVSTSKLRKLAGVSCDHSIEIHLLWVKHSRQIIDAGKRQGGLRRFPKSRKHRSKMGSRIPRTPARTSGNLAIGTIFDGSCGAFGRDGNCKLEPPLSF